MKQYRYVKCSYLENYNDWDIVQILPRINNDTNPMAIIMKEDKPTHGYIKLNEATNEQLIEELMKRLKENK